jgi:diguanylate cyclase (GGDEF)-like protein
LIVLSETSVEGAILFAERMRTRIEATTFESPSSAMKLTASLGLAVIEPAKTPFDARNLVRRADQSLYDAKHAGKNRVCIFDFGKVTLRRTS